MAEYKENVADYGLDIHCQMIIEEFRDSQVIFKKIKDVVVESLRKKLRSIHMVVDLVEARVKTEESLVGKLEMKGAKYKTLSDVTDIVGARIVSFYTDEVDKVAAMVESLFDVDWDNSVDKRKLLKVDSFGYMSLHYVCRIPESLYRDPEHPELNQIRFEVQMRTALQHVWASMNHDIGYKSGVEVPGDYLRSLMRLAGMLELADVEFSRIRKEITDYRRKVEGLVKSGNFADITINADSFRSYLALDPFSALNSKIAAINQAEAHVKAGGKGKTYMYYFAKRSTKDPWLGACHSVELGYVFLNPYTHSASGKVDMELARKVSRAWTNFARTGNPSIDGIAWPEYDLANRATMVIGNDNSFKVVNDPKREQREFVQEAMRKFQKEGK